MELAGWEARVPGTQPSTFVPLRQERDDPVWGPSREAEASLPRTPVADAQQGGEDKTQGSGWSGTRRPGSQESFCTYGRAPPVRQSTAKMGSRLILGGPWCRIAHLSALGTKWDDETAPLQS